MLRAALILVRIPLATLLATLTLAPVASAFEYSGQRLATDARIEVEVYIAVSFWRDRGLTSCAGGIQAFYAPSLLDADGVEALGRGADCQIWLRDSYVKMLRNRHESRAMRRSDAEDECFIVVHETGHALGLEHTHDGGVMDPVRHIVPWECRKWARDRYARR